MKQNYPPEFLLDHFGLVALEVGGGRVALLAGAARGRGHRKSTKSVTVAQLFGKDCQKDVAFGVVKQTQNVGLPRCCSM